jgi:ATP-dependent DNA helicase RecG
MPLMGNQPREGNAMCGMKESEIVELKKSLAELHAGLVSISAILNKHGRGELWFGIKDNGQVVGLPASAKTLRDISQAIAAHIEPRIYPKITAETLDQAVCIKLAFEGTETPYYAYGRAYMRVADEDRQLSARELERLIVAKNQGQYAWDSAIADKKVTDLDEGKLRAFVGRARLTWDNPVNALTKLGLLKNGQVLNAATLFFDRDASMQLRCAVFGTQESAMILDRHDFDGDILELIEEAQKYILKNIHIGMRLEGLYRVDVPEIPVEALREAIINAFCHRDYRDPDYVQVAVFKDRVEIRSPGCLYGLITIDDLRKGFVSQRRNPLIADLFRRIEMVEAWGRGMPLILKQVPDVIFREVGNLFIVSFNRPSFVEGETPLIETPKKTSKASTKKFGKESSVKKFGKESSVKTGQKILALLATQREMTIPELAVKLALAPRTIEKQIVQLRNTGQLLRVGGRKLGHWEVLT